MWKTQLNRAVKELRFVLKSGKEHHGSWKFVSEKLPELRMLNQLTFFSIEELNDKFETPSAVHVLYGDLDNTEHKIDTAGLSDAALEKVLKDKVSFGLGLRRRPVLSNADRSLPVDVVEAHKYVHYVDDKF
eukprot:gene37169-45113_t